VSMLDNIGVPGWAIDEAEKAADALFEGTLELIKWSIERRRQLACWRAVKLAEIILRVNAWRAERGRRPRPFYFKRRRLIAAEAECKANREANPELEIVCKAAHERMAWLGIVPTNGAA
jgi:hypothetical protein